MGMTEAGALRRRLARRIVESGDLTSPGWRMAFEQVPRHVFVPRIVGCWPPFSSDTEITVDRQSHSDLWLELVYSDRLLFIVNDGSRRSSSSMPSVMARFLELLDVHDGGVVLEIGTGSGYNAAILCHRLGSEHVTSIDIDAELVEAAGPRLAACGYTPTLAVADGWQGYAPRAPYDRIIATCAVPRIPEAWIEQLRPGGVIVAPLRGGRFEAAGLVGLRRRDDGSLTGRLHPRGAAFMPMRKGPEMPMPASRERLRSLAQGTDGEERPCTIPAWLEGTDDGLSPYFFLRLHERDDWEWFWLSGPHGEPRAPAAAAPDGSWARVIRRPRRTFPNVVLQGGPRRLWDLVEESYAQYLRLGSPGLGRYGLEVEPSGRQFIWLDRPGSTYAWEL